MRSLALPSSDIDTVVVGGLKALDPKRPLREADNDLHRRRAARCQLTHFGGRVCIAPVEADFSLRFDSSDVAAMPYVPPTKG